MSTSTRPVYSMVSGRGRAAAVAAPVVAGVIVIAGMVAGAVPPETSVPKRSAAEATTAGAATQSKADSDKSDPAAKAKELPFPDLPPKAVPLNKQQTVYLDSAGKRLHLKTHVVLRRGQLEMFCCLKQTKEHESIVSVDCKAYVVHAGLLTLGAKPGKPVQFVPKFVPPSGQRIDVFVRWLDAAGKEHRRPAQKWIRTSPERFYVAAMKQLPADVKLPDDVPLRFDAKNAELSWYGRMKPETRDRLLKLSADEKFQAAIRQFFTDSQPQPMKTHWVFTGSGFYVDPTTGRQEYAAEGGELICVANFSTATLDVAMASTASNDESLLFEAATEQIPAEGTPVIVELVPAFETQPAASPDKQKPGAAE